MAQPTAPIRSEPASARLKPHANANVHARFMADLEKMTSAEFMASLVEAGIYTSNGELTEHYKDHGEALDAEE